MSSYLQEHLAIKEPEKSLRNWWRATAEKNDLKYLFKYLFPYIFVNIEFRLDIWKSMCPYLQFSTTFQQLLLK